MRRIVQLVVLALLSGLLLAATGTAPSQASDSGARISAHKAKHHKAKHHKKRKKKHAARKPVSPWTYCWPGVPSLSGTPKTGGVQFQWAGTSCATRYRVHVSPAWYGEWPGTPWYTPWTTSTARSVGYSVPTAPRTGDGMLAVPYANPVFAQMEVNNGANTHATATHRSTWIAKWPAAPAPSAGDRIRFGSYNVMLYPTLADGTGNSNGAARVRGIANNIGSHDVTLVALQEARQTTAADVVSTLNAGSYGGGSWSYVHANGATVSTPGQQILYRNDLFAVLDSGVFDMANPKDTSNHVVGPWAKLVELAPTTGVAEPFYVSSLHFAGTASASWAQNAATGAAAQLVMNYLGGLTNGAPTILAGDLRYGREPWGERAGYVPAQPVFVRGGYYDAMASQSMAGQNYSIVNAQGGVPTAHQTPNPSGAGPRSDHILMKGITGSWLYRNVVDWSYGGVVPSDHNLIFADIDLPTVQGP